MSTENRLIIIHAGGEKGFVSNTLTTWKATNHSGDYPDNVNQEIFMKWITEKLFPNLEPNNLVEPILLVVENAPYHNVLVDKAPSSKSKIQDIKDNKHNIPFSEEMFVPELYKLITLHKLKFFRYLPDESVQAKGHRS